MLSFTIKHFKVGKNVIVSKFGYSNLQGIIVDIDGENLKVEINGIIFNFTMDEII